MKPSLAHPIPRTLLSTCALAALLAAPAAWAANTGCTMNGLICEGDPPKYDVMIDSDVYFVYGRKGSAIDVSGAQVTVTGGTVASVAGGYTDGSGNATKNRVFINGGDVVGVIGGQADGSGSATGNKVFINGGIVNGLMGGYAKGSGNATSNFITLSGGRVAGGMAGGNSGSGDAVTGNTLIVDKAIDFSVGGKVENFEKLEFVLPASIKDTDTMLKVGGDATFAAFPTDGFTLTVDGAPALKKDNTITLIAATGTLTISGYPTTVTDGEYEFELSDDGKNLIAKVTKPLPTYNVNGVAVPAEGGEVKCTPTTVKEGEAATCTATEKEGYEITSFTVSGTVDTSECGSPCVLKNIASDVEVTVEFTELSQTPDPTPTPYHSDSSSPTMGELGLLLSGIALAGAAAPALRRREKQSKKSDTHQ